MDVSAFASVLIRTAPAGKITVHFCAKQTTNVGFCWSLHIREVRFTSRAQPVEGTATSPSPTSAGGIEQEHPETR
jgi:hypothetical protein